jgi:hypothetical protein
VINAGNFAIKEEYGFYVFLVNLFMYFAKRTRKAGRSEQQLSIDADNQEIDTLQATFASFDRSRFRRRLSPFSKDKFEMSE